MNVEQLIFSDLFVASVGSVGFTFTIIYFIMRANLMKRIAYTLFKVIGFVCCMIFPFLLIKNFQLAGVEIPYSKEVQYIYFFLYVGMMLLVIAFGIATLFKKERENIVKDDKI